MNDQPPKRSFPTWSMIVGAIFGFITLIFFMVLVLLIILGHTLPPAARFPLLSTLALGVALSVAFFGGGAAAKGKIPIPGFNKNPVTFSTSGGIATFIIVFLFGYYMYPNPAQNQGGTKLPDEKPDSTRTIQEGSNLSDIVPNIESWPGEVDTFDGATQWSLGSDTSGEYIQKLGRKIIGGRYQWNISFNSSGLYYYLSPYGSAADFFVSTDIIFSSQNTKRVTAGIVFGSVGELSTRNSGNYQLHIEDSKGEWGLSYSSNQSNDWLINPSKPSHIVVNFQKPVRVGVLVEDGYMRFFINNILVGNWRDPGFNGGDVGMFVGSDKGDVIVEFDNFELRRKPRS